MARPNGLVFRLLLMFCTFILPGSTALAQGWEAPGKAIGKVSVAGSLILLELDEGALGEQKLFDLGQRTVRFTPAGAGYRVENLPLNWDADFGRQLGGQQVTLQNFAFPFSGKSWNSFTVGVTGSIGFGEKTGETGEWGAPPRGDEGGVSIGRFDPLSAGAANLVNTVPAICVFFKPRMTGNEFVKELADRVVVTWDVTEPWGNIQDFTWTKTVNRFQAVLHKDGVIELSYQELSAKDAIVGVYPLISGGVEKALATLRSGEKSATSTSSSLASVPAAHLNIRNVKLAVVDGFFLKVTFETAGSVLPAGDPGISGIGYHLYFAAHKPSREAAGAAAADMAWSIRGFAPRHANAGKSRYVAFGPGLSRGVKVSGNTISMQGILPPTLRGVAPITVFAESSAAGSETPVARIPPQPVDLGAIRNPEVHLASLTQHDGPFPLLYESFHYYALPNARDLTCSVIKTLGDRYDFLAYYSDFRVDNQEAGTPSDGPLGAVGGAVTGIGAKQSGLDRYCTPGRFQWQYIQPVYVGSNQMQERPPQDAPVATERDITFYQPQLAEISQDGKMPPYMYAMSQIAHEMGHRWAAFVSAKVGDETIPLGPTHWARGLQAVVPFPYVRPTEASIMGGGVWLDNFDGTYTQLDDDYYVPATGFSYLDLYLMGLISPAEVPDFFLLRNLVPAGKDASGHPIFKADRTKVTIQDVIAAEGPRTPGVDESQRKFNTGMVMVVQHGAQPSRELIARTNGIRLQWMEYFSITTGRRAFMTTNPE
jgi:hypothetical protein